MDSVKWPPMNHLYRFGQFVLDSRRRTLSHADSPVSLTPKAFDVLLFLAQNPNRLVTKEELLQAVWGDTFVEEGNLTQSSLQSRRSRSCTSPKRPMLRRRSFVLRFVTRNGEIPLPPCGSISLS